MSKPKFDPSKPFKASAPSKPAFDESRPFKASANAWDTRADGVMVRNVPQNGPGAPDDATDSPVIDDQTKWYEALAGSADVTDLGKRGSAAISAAQGRFIDRSPSGQLREVYPAMVQPLATLAGVRQRAALYSQSLSALRSHYDQAKDEHPWPSAAGTIGPLLPLGAVGLMGTLGVGAGVGALQSRNNPIEKPIEFGKDVAVNTALSGIGYGTGKVVGGLASYGARKTGALLEDAATGNGGLRKVIPENFSETFGREFGENASAPQSVSAANQVAKNIDRVSAPGAENIPITATLSGLFGRAMRFDTDGMNAQGEGLMMKYGPTIDRTMKNIGIETPTPEKWVSRDFDITMQMQRKLREKGLTGVAEKTILKNPEYQHVRTGEEKVRMVENALEDTGNKISEFVSKFDAKANRGQRFSPSNVADRIEREVLAPLEQHGSDLDGPAIAAVRSQVNSLRAYGDKGLSFESAFSRIRQLDKHLKWDSSGAVSAPTRDALRQVRGIMKGETESAVEDIAISSGDMGLLDEWKQLKTQYGALSEFSDMASKRLLDAKDGNRFFSLTDNIWGAGALATAPGIVAGSPTAALTGLTGVLGMAGAKWARERGPQMMALSLQKKGWEAAQAALTENPNVLGPFAQSLREEAVRGGAPAAMALHNALMARNPEYAQRVIGLAEESAKQSLAR